MTFTTNYAAFGGKGLLSGPHTTYTNVYTVFSHCFVWSFLSFYSRLTTGASRCQV